MTYLRVVIREDLMFCLTGLGFGVQFAKEAYRIFEGIETFFNAMLTDQYQMEVRLVMEVPFSATLVVTKDFVSLL